MGLEPTTPPSILLSQLSEFHHSKLLSEGWDIYKQSKEIIEGRYKLDQTSYKYNESVATNFEKLYN